MESTFKVFTEECSCTGRVVGAEAVVLHTVILGGVKLPG